jgi:hypothetical protein
LNSLTYCHAHPDRLPIAGVRLYGARERVPASRWSGVISS